MKREIIKTADGSTTIHLPEWNEHYHSKHGAVQEAIHVFIKNGLDRVKASSISVLEMGFGTGLNALITLLEGQKRDLKLLYTGIEAFPISAEEASQMNFTEMFNQNEVKYVFNRIHEQPWNTREAITDFFQLHKVKARFDEVRYQNQFDLVYFDAFGPRVHPEAWEQPMLQKMFNALKEGGIFTTYCAKGSVRRGLQELGFEVQKVPGPPGKREMLVATKPVN